MHEVQRDVVHNINTTLDWRTMVEGVRCWRQYVKLHQDYAVMALGLKSKDARHDCYNNGKVMKEQLGARPEHKWKQFQNDDPLSLGSHLMPSSVYCPPPRVA